MIRLNNVTISFGDGKTPVEALSLTLPDSGAAVFTGASGSGKTTVLRAVAGLIKPTSGEVTGLENKRLSFVFQEDRLLPWLNAIDNVRFGSDKISAEKAAYWLKRVELEGRENDSIAALSGGMKRRVAIARALCYGGDILFMDEPYKGLDDALAGRVHEVVRARFPLILAAVHEKREAELLHADCVIEL